MHTSYCAATEVATMVRAKAVMKDLVVLRRESQERCIGFITAVSYDEYYAYRRATIAAEANITALEEEYLLMQ
jgi:hypothetical protein